MTENNKSLETVYVDNGESYGWFNFSQVAKIEVPNRSSGEAHGIVDFNSDGSDDLVYFISSTRDGTLPVDNDVLFIENNRFNFKGDFVIDQYGTWPIAKAQNSIGISGGPVQSSWAQDAVVADFDGDGQEDLFFSGHGLEFVPGMTGDFDELLSTLEKNFIMTGRGTICKS